MGPLRRLLNSNLVRGIALPLRASHPQLYATLNLLRRRVLSGRSELDAYQANAIAKFRQLAPLLGCRVLEIGSDPRLRVLDALARSGVHQAIGVNNSPALWREHPAKVLHGAAGVELREGDATALAFDDDSFDHIFSVATFEHIDGLARALDEMFRVLKPGGLCYASFGPLWSAGKGHHLKVEVGGEEYRHFMPEKNPLPDFCHLLLSPDELRASVVSHVPPEAVEPIVHWVYEDPEINRLFHHEYLAAFRRSPFRVRAISAERDPVDRQLLRMLRFRHPAEQAFDVTNMDVVLAKTW